jgi:hypothetical protein
MPRWVTTLVGVAVVGLAVWLVASSYHPPKPIGHGPKTDAAVEDDGGGILFALGDGGLARDAGDALLVSDLALADPLRDLRLDAGAGVLLADGTTVPPLPVTAPRQVRFGVVLVSYAGAQPSVAGGRPAVRSKGDAKNLADRLRVTAEQDFHAAVQQGDAGSADDVGRVKLGILELAPEYVLFTLPVGAVGMPVDTPRGYWIVKRLE